MNPLLCMCEFRVDDGDASIAAGCHDLILEYLDVIDAVIV